VDSPPGHNKEELPVILEGGPRDHKYRIKSTGTSCGFVVRGYPTPNRQGVEVLVGVNQPVPQRPKSASIYLAYRIDSVLGIVPEEISSHPDLVMVREDRRNQRDAFVRGESMADQLFPGWRDGLVGGEDMADQAFPGWRVREICGQKRL
jgi:hypothetical protein